MKKIIYLTTLLLLLSLSFAQNCESNDECLNKDSSKPICSELVGCTKCNSSSECIFDGGLLPICSKDGTCTECTSHDECFSKSNTLCVDSICVNCETDEDCAVFNTEDDEYICYRKSKVCKIKCSKDADCEVEEPVESIDYRCNTTTNECYELCSKEFCGDPDDITGLIIAYVVICLAMLIFIMLFICCACAKNESYGPHVKLESSSKPDANDEIELEETSTNVKKRKHKK